MQVQSRTIFVHRAVALGLQQAWAAPQILQPKIIALLSRPLSSILCLSPPRCLRVQCPPPMMLTFHQFPNLSFFPPTQTTGPSVRMPLLAVQAQPSLPFPSAVFNPLLFSWPPAPTAGPSVRMPQPSLPFPPNPLSNSWPSASAVDANARLPPLVSQAQKPYFPP